MQESNDERRSTTTSGAPRPALEPVARTEGTERPAIERLSPRLAELGPRLVRRLTKNFHDGSLVVRDELGSFHAGEGLPIIEVEVHDLRTYAAILRYGSEGLGESYIAGWWDCEDIAGLVALLVRNLEPMVSLLDRFGAAVSGPWSALQRLKVPTMHRDRKNVQAHYDLPGELFELMLDETMSYSCAVFEHPGQTLGDAQRAKLDRLCQKLELTEDDHLLEIGTGWGGLAIHAASNYGCRVTTTTISDAQRRLAQQRVDEAGLSDRIEVLGVDYRSLDGVYDKLVSVEMIEAVDWRLYETFFRTCRRLVRPDGLVAIQAITIADRSFERAKHHDDFIRRQVFPGGCLPSISALNAAMVASTDFVLRDVDDIGLHYVETLRRWRARFEDSWPTMESFGFDDRFHRLWRLYLAYCEGAFAERHISDVQLVLSGPEHRPALRARPV